MTTSWPLDRSDLHRPAPHPDHVFSTTPTRSRRTTSDVRGSISLVELREAYGELEVDLGADRETVLQARRILLRVWHPDRHQQDPRLGEAAAKKTTRLNEAFELIEAAEFPGPEHFARADDKPTATQSTSRSECASWNFASAK